MSNALQFTAETMPAGWAALLPCPFCNSPARLCINLRRPPSDAPTDAFVECLRCGSAGPLVERDNMTQEQIARFVARKWNRRSMHTNAGWKLQRIAQILGSDYIGPADSPHAAMDAAALRAAPEGFVMVPEIATEAMLSAAFPRNERIDAEFDRQGAWADCLAARPQGVK